MAMTPGHSKQAGNHLGAHAACLTLFRPPCTHVYPVSLLSSLCPVVLETESGPKVWGVLENMP